MSRPLDEDVKFQRAMNAQAAGSTDVNGSEVDTEGFDTVTFVAMIGTLTATQVTQMHAEAAIATGGTFNDIAGSQTDAMDDADSNQAIILEIHEPPRRFVRPVLERGTANAVIDGIMAILSNAKDKPTTHDATTIQTSKVVKQAAIGSL